MDRSVLRARLAEAFDGSDAECRAVARTAGDLADAGTYEADVGGALTVDAVIDNLADAPEDGVADRWNWWMGALELAYGGYDRFQVRRWRED